MQSNEKKLVRAIQLRTGFRVYLCLLRLRRASTKDVQKALEFRAPAQARYHLRRLVELGLAREEENANFSVVKRKFGILRFFFKVRNAIFPMSLFYSVFFASLTVFLYLRSPSIEIVLLGALITIKEAADTYSYFDLL